MRISATVYKERKGIAPNASPQPAPLADTISYVAVVQKGPESRTELISSTVADLGKKLQPYAQEAGSRFSLKFHRGSQEDCSKDRESLRPSEIGPLLEAIRTAGI